MQHQDREHGSSRTRPARAVPARESLHVLLAEDDADFRTLLVRAFRARGHRVTECVGGSDLVSKLGTYVLFGPPAGFDLVVSDIRMPDATALQILEALRECEELPPFILVTAFPSEEIRDAAARLGVVAVFEKPCELDDLVAQAEGAVVKRSGDLP